MDNLETGTNPGTTLFGTGVTRIERDSPGWYGEVGVHMFFALRYSVVLNGYYRSAKTRGLALTGTNDEFLNLSDGQPFELDLSGIGGRAALCIGF